MQGDAKASVERTRDKYAEALIRCLGIAFALLLHLAILCWLALPATPLQQLSTPSDSDAAIDVRLIEVRHELIHSEPTASPLSRSPLKIQSAQKKVARSPQPTVTKSTSKSLPDIAQPASGEPAPMDMSPAQPEAAIPYGNSRFNESLQRNQSIELPQIPGDGEPVLAQGIHVNSAPSVSQILHNVGHTLRCKDALFKSRMANDGGDAQLAQRGMTYQQAKLEWTELNCP
jgi:hypothetical protein